MGQGYSLTTLSAGTAGIDVPELSHLSYEKSLGEARFMKTIRARHRHGLVAVKVAIKPYNNMSFRGYITKIMNERKVLTEIPNALSYYNAFETASNGFLVRQFVYSSLYDRVSTRPFLEDVEKCWLAYQLLSAVRDSHTNHVYHGDIKSENILVTSWNWLYLTDFSSTFKPTHLPEDNPAEFSFYFDIAGRRTCYLAPERFLGQGETQGRSKSLNWAMDIFSVGCVIAELFLETPIFNLSQLFNYKKGEYNPHTAHLLRIENAEIREMVSHMIQLEPESRYSADEYLNFWRGKAFPEYFSSFLHQYMALITDPSSGKSAITGDESNLGESDDRISRVYHDFDKIAYFLGYSDAQLPDTGRAASLPDAASPLDTDLPRRRQMQKIKMPGEEGTFLFMNIVTSSLRSTARSSARIQACDLLLAFSEHISDDAKLDRVLPFLMTLLDDPCEIVKIAALRSIAQLVSLTASTSPVNAFVFPEYILPKLAEMFTSKRGRPRQNILVRLTFAQCISPLAEAGAKFLDSAEALKIEGSLPSGNQDVEDALSLATYQNYYDSTRASLISFFETQSKQLLTDSQPGIRRTFLGAIASLCIFFGSAKTNDVILSHLNTYLNDRDWRLKCSFFDAIVGVAVYVGSSNLEEFILPLMLLALTDIEEAVLGSVLRSLAVMAALGLFQRPTIFGLLDIVSRFAMHPNSWIRESSANFLASITRYLSPADLHCIVIPATGLVLKSPPSSFNEVNFLDILKKPLDRDVFDLTFKWAQNSSKSTFWKHVKKADAATRSDGRYFTVSMRDLSTTSFAKMPKNETDQQWIRRLRDAGMSREDELKLMALAEYVWRVALKAPGGDGTSESLQLDKQVTLSSLKVQINTFQIDAEQELWSDGALQDPSEEDTGETVKPQTISDALLDASSTINRSADEFSDPNRAETPSPNVREGVGQLQTTAYDPRRQETSSQPSPRENSPREPNSVRKDSMKPAEQAQGPNRTSAMELMQRRSTGGKAMPDLATSPANAEGRMDSIPQGRNRVSSKVRNDDRLNSSHPTNPRLLALSGYGGRDPNVLRLLESLAVADHPPGALDLGPEINRDKRRPLLQRNGNINVEKPWEVNGVTVATFSEHTGPINRVLVSPDDAFFVTASDDGSIKIWDASRLERNVAHRSRQTYKHAPGARVTALTFLENSNTFASAANDGSIHVLRPELTEPSQEVFKYNKVRLVRSWRIPEPKSHAVWVEHIKKRFHNSLMLATNTGKIHCLNLDTMSLEYTLQNPAHHGTPTCFCVGRSNQHWLLLGTSRGILDLWDLRFHVRIHSFAFAEGCPISRISMGRDVGEDSGHPSSDNHPAQIFVSGGLATPEVTAWDMDDFKCHGTWRTTEAVPSQVQGSNTKSQSAMASVPDTKRYVLVNADKESAHQPSKSNAGHTALSESDRTAAESRGSPGVNPFILGITELPSSAGSIVSGTTSSPFLFAAGPGTSLRLWNLSKGQTSHSFAVTGPSPGQSAAASLSFEQPGVWNGIAFHDELLPRESDKSQNDQGEKPKGRRKDTFSGGKSSATTGQDSASQVEDAKKDGEEESNSASKVPQPRLEQQSLLRTHLDAITDVAVIERPYRMFISVDRGGSIFVFA